MSHNLHISYDLYKPGQNYETVIERIKSLGDWARIHLSLWYVDSQYTAEQASNHVWAVMDRNDKLYVVDATNNTAAWHNLPDETTKFIQQHWNH